MIGVKIRQDTRAVQKMLKGLKNGADTVISRALNKTTAKTKTVALRKVAKEIGLPIKKVRAAFRVIKATRNLHRASINVKGPRLPLTLFKAKDKSPAGVVYKHKGQRKQLPHAFMAKMPSGNIGVFQRKGASRMPIKELYGPSIPYTFIQKKITKAMNDDAAIAWAKNIKHELKYFISKQSR